MAQMQLNGSCVKREFGKPEDIKKFHKELEEIRDQRITYNSNDRHNDAITDYYETSTNSTYN